MAIRKLLIALLSMLLVKCADYDNHVLKVEKSAESLNGIKFSVSLSGGNEIDCKGEVKYNDVILHKFDITSYNWEKPLEFLINYSEFPDIAQQLAIDFTLNKNPRIEIFVQNKENNFFRTEYLTLNPRVPPVMTGIDLQNSGFAKKYPIRYKQEIYDLEYYLNQYNLRFDDHTLEKIATVSLLIKSNTKMLPAIVPADENIPIYKDKNKITASVLCDSISSNPHLVLYPAKNNKYYDGPNLYDIANAHYTGLVKSMTNSKLFKDKYLLEREFDVSGLNGEYDLYLIIADKTNYYFYYDLGAVIFDNIAPEFDEWSVGSYYFRGNELFEGKVYLEYTIPYGRNPYDVIFSGKVFGDVKSLYVDGKGIDFKKNNDLIFSQKIYIDDGFKDIKIEILDEIGNLKNYYLPLIISQ